VTAYLLDTTVFIHQWKRNARVMAWIDSAMERNDDLFTTSVNVAEIYGGSKPEDRVAWDAFFGRFTVLPILPLDGAWAGRTQFDLARRGVRVQLADAMIAAVATARGLTVATENGKDFEAMGVPVELVPATSQRPT
jgi:predicted nucleic acid-binding protein